MRIDGNYNIDPRSATDGKSALPLPAKPADAAPAAPTVDQMAIEHTKSPYVQAATSGDDVNTQAVEDARKLLDSGQLDTPQSVRAAAEAILRMGV